MGIFVAGVTQWLIDILSLRKLRLDIRRIKAELDAKKSTIPIATLDEIIEFSQTKPSSHRLKRFLSSKLQYRLPDDAKVEVPPDMAAHYSAALTSVLRETISLRDLLYSLFFATLIVHAIVAGVYSFPRLVELVVEHPYFFAFMAFLGINGLIHDYSVSRTGRD